MSVESIRRDTFARDLGLISVDGKASERALADLIRVPLSRWGLSPRSHVLRYARDQLDAAGLRDRLSQLLPAALKSLTRLGECADVVIGDERYIAPAPPRWIRTGEASAALLSVAPAPDGIVEHVPRHGGSDVVRRIQVQSDDDLVALRMAGVGETTMDGWLKPHAYLECARRKERRPVRSDEMSLARFWELLASAVASDGLALGDDGEVRIVVGEPGGYFGRHDQDTCEGRWSEVAPDGVWCAYRRGYGIQHWQPIVLAVAGRSWRALDLYDHDEWRWALIARGRHAGSDEQVSLADGTVRVSFPAPDQLITAMDILGPRCSPWSWQVEHLAPNPWLLLK